MRNVLFLSIFILIACSGGHNSGTSDSDTLTLKYAEMLTVESRDGYTLVSVADPWNAGRTLHTYALVSHDADLPVDMPDATVVRTPVRRAVIATSVHCALAVELGCGDNIAGVCDLQYINIPWIQERSRAGRISDCGNSMSPTIEKIIDTEPDAIFLSPFQNSGGYGRVGELGIPIIEMADYMETGPLARAEWMRFYGLLFGAGERADSLFDGIESRYNELKTMAASSPGSSVMMDKPVSGVWYVPGGNSTIGRLIADANAGYAWADDERSGSIELSFETVLDKCADADVWMMRYYSPTPLRTAALLAENTGYRQFKALREGEVYGCNTAVSTFYEDTPFHPERLLRDFIIITHPEINGLGETAYFEKLK